MEELKAKHNHKLTDILKVAIFGLMLILPGLILLPSMLYYGVNEHATAPTEQVEKIEYERVNFNQLYNSQNYNDHNVITTFDDNLLHSISIGENDNSTYFNSAPIINIINTNTYVLSINIISNNGDLPSTFALLNTSNLEINISNTGLTRGIFTANANVNSTVGFVFTGSFSCDFTYQANIFNLTQMFGAGNEPTLQQFNNWYPNEYYEYTESKWEVLEIPTGTYETYTDITSQIQFNWNSLWQQPLFNWTNYTILKQGLDNFTYVFGITQTSYINNLITYELIIVAIYIVIDIVLTLFKWLTHMVGSKE